MSAVTSWTVSSKEMDGGLTLITASESLKDIFYFHIFPLLGSFGIAKEELATIWLVRTTCSLIFATTAVTLLSRLTVEKGVFKEHIKNRQTTKTCIRLTAKKSVFKAMILQREIEHMLYKGKCALCRLCLP